MRHTTMHERVLERIQPIERSLCEAMASSVTDAEAAAKLARIPLEPIYQPTRVHIARASARAKLEKLDLGVWNVDQTERHNAALHLYCDDMAMRMLHSPTGIAPAPGSNHKRRAWYTAPISEVDGTLLPPTINLIGIWTADFRTGMVDVRIVRPIAPWKFGAAERIDLSIPLDPNAAFTSAGFGHQDEEEDLVLPTRREASEEEGGAHASA